jgi:hypothetical protein
MGLSGLRIPPGCGSSGGGGSNNGLIESRLGQLEARVRSLEGQVVHQGHLIAHLQARLSACPGIPDSSPLSSPPPEDSEVSCRSALAGGWDPVGQKNFTKNQILREGCCV